MPKAFRGINLAKGLTKERLEETQAMDIRFDTDSKEITYWIDGVQVDGDLTFAEEGENTIQLDLTQTGSGSGSAALVGISFPAGADQPGGNFAPGRVFGPRGTDIPAWPGKRPQIQTYGSYAQSGEFKIQDNNLVPRGHEPVTYSYALWVQYPAGSNDPSSYYSSEPKIHNEEPPPPDDEKPPKPHGHHG